MAADGKHVEANTKPMLKPLTFVRLLTDFERNGQIFHAWLQLTGNEKEIADLHEWFHEEIQHDEEVDEESRMDAVLDFDLKKEVEPEACVDAMVRYFNDRDNIVVTKCKGKLTLPRLSDGQLDTKALLNRNAVLFSNIESFFK